MARTDPQLNFRIPADLKARLEAAAEKNQRTLTGELVARLEASFKTFVDVGVEQESEPETLTIKETSRWPWPAEVIARFEEKLERIEKAVTGSAHIEMQPMTATGGDAPAPKQGKALPVTSAQPYKPGESLPRPPLTRYGKPRK